MVDVNKAIEKKFALAAELALIASRVRNIVYEAADYYANGGPGVGQAVVGDRFQPSGNARFAPLSTSYFEWKSGVSKEMNKQQKMTYGRGSRLVDVKVGTKVQPDATGTYQVKDVIKKSLPILVLSGELRARVTGRNHPIRVQGDTAWITFSKLPKYAIYHHAPKKAPFPKRSPVEPNANDIRRVQEFINRQIAKYTARITKRPVAFGGGQARIIK